MCANKTPRGRTRRPSPAMCCRQRISHTQVKVMTTWCKIPGQARLRSLPVPLHLLPMGTRRIGPVRRHCHPVESGTTQLRRRTVGRPPRPWYGQLTQPTGSGAHSSSRFDTIRFLLSPRSAAVPDLPETIRLFPEGGDQTATAVRVVRMAGFST